MHLGYKVVVCTCFIRNFNEVITTIELTKTPNSTFRYWEGFICKKNLLQSLLQILFFAQRTNFIRAIGERLRSPSLDRAFSIAISVGRDSRYLILYNFSVLGSRDISFSSIHVRKLVDCFELCGINRIDLSLCHHTMKPVW